MFSNLDDMHENGIHDYLKFIKLGYGRGTDHSCKDIRGGLMTREQGIEMVREYDHVKPMRDLERWLKYVDMSEEEFDVTCDTFRDQRVWRIENGQWVKDTIWGEPASLWPSSPEQRQGQSLYLLTYGKVRKRLGFEGSLGGDRHRLWRSAGESLNQHRLTVIRALIPEELFAPGRHIFDFGCGWPEEDRWKLMFVCSTFSCAIKGFQ